MEQLIQNFKALFHHMNEEKEILSGENQRLSHELEQFKEFFDKLNSMNMAINGNNQIEQNGAAPNQVYYQDEQQNGQDQQDIDPNQAIQEGRNENATSEQENL